MVKTIVGKEDLCEIISHYDLGKPKKIEAIQTGAVQSNYRCELEGLNVILRLYENRNFNEISYEVDVLNQLKKRGYKCPFPYERNDGSYIGLMGEKHYVLYEFIEGMHLENPTQKQKEELVEAVANFNIAAKGIRSEYEKYRMNYNVKFCKSHAKAIAEKINTANSLAKYKWYESEIENLVFPKNMSMGVCHSDFHFTNIMYKNGKFNGLIDFDDANYTYSVYDLVCLLDPFEFNNFSWHNWQEFDIESLEFDFEKTREIIKIYCKINPLEEVDLMHIYDVLKLTVFIDCLWFFERGDVNEFFERRKIEFLNRMGRARFAKEILRI